MSPQDTNLLRTKPGQLPETSLLVRGRFTGVTLLSAKTPKHVPSRNDCRINGAASRCQMAARLVSGMSLGCLRDCRNCECRCPVWEAGATGDRHSKRRERERTAQIATGISPACRADVRNALPLAAPTWMTRAIQGAGAGSLREVNEERVVPLAAGQDHYGPSARRTFSVRLARSEPTIAGTSYPIRPSAPSPPAPPACTRSSSSPPAWDRPHGPRTPDPHTPDTGLPAALRRFPVPASFHLRPRLG